MTINEKTWKEFRDTGLLWWINRQLHLFGWVLVAEATGETIHRVFPARTNGRGFMPELEDSGFKKLGTYLAENAKQLVAETEQ